MPVSLDETLISELLEMLGEQDFEGIIETFQQYSLDLFSNISTSCEEGALDEAVLLIHSLKGCCKNIGAVSLSQECADLEELAREGELDKVANALPVLRSSFEITLEALNHHISP